MDVLVDAGMQATMNQNEMNVYVTILAGIELYGIEQLGFAMVVILPISAGIVVTLGVYLKRKKR